jgi:hypothetical protein
MKTSADVRDEFMKEFRALIKKWNASLDANNERGVVVCVPARYSGWNQSSEAAVFGLGRYFLHHSVLDWEVGGDV